MIIDTNALSAAAEGDPDVAKMLDGASRLALPVIVIGEYRFGIGQSRWKTKYSDWLTSFIADCWVLKVDEQSTIHYADIAGELKQIGTPIPANDLWIASLCRQHSLPLLSRDRHFDKVSGIRRLTW